MEKNIGMQNKINNNYRGEKWNKSLQRLQIKNAINYKDHNWRKNLIKTKHEKV